MPTYLICIALLGFLCFALGFNVSLARARTNSIFEGVIDPENSLYKARRAHSNTIEYAPILAILIYVLGQSAQPGWVIWTMIIATFSRYLIVAGLLLPRTMAKPNPMRFLGALGTYVAGFLLSGALLFQAMISQAA
ncbi:MAG: MAPEG family protein [bacterium]